MCSEFGLGDAASSKVLAASLGHNTGDISKNQSYSVMCFGFSRPSIK